MTGRRIAPLLPALAMTMTLAVPRTAEAQSASIAEDGVGVARISVLAGNVAVQRGDSSESLAAVLNAPVLGGDYLTTAESSRAEVQFDGRAQLRVGRDTQLRFTRIDSGDRNVQLAEGTVDLRLLSGTDGTNEIDTPSIAVKPESTGSYRVAVNADGQTLVTVRSGRAEIETPQGSQELTPGSTLVAQGAAGNPSIQTVAAVAFDDFDAFNDDRDRVYTRALADASFVDPQIGGVEDLPSYGRWVTDGSYGHVWVPAGVASDWAPYRDGNWVWEDGYGWTWVGAEPWGWAPYHYGSWYHSPNYGWCWDPPQPRVYAPWRPALVAFIGFGIGSGIGVSLGFGGGPEFENIGWVPLAPGEPYHPWWGDHYGGNTTIVNNVTNITNVTNVTNVNVYRNVQYNAVSSVTSQRFIQGRFGHTTPVAAAELRDARAQAFRGALPVQPTAANLRFTNSASATPVAVHPALLQRAFAGNTAVVHRTPFTEQRVAFAAATHAPITPLNFRDVRTTPIIGGSAAADRAARPAAFAPRSAPAPQDVAPRAQAARGEASHPVTPAAPSYARPAATSAGAGARDPWARFNASRAVPPPQRAQAPAASRAFAAFGDRQQTAPGTAERASAAPPMNTYHAPAASTYRAPAANTYHAPAANTYRAPAENMYHAPAANTYRAPAENMYRAPAAHAYRAPAANTYHAPAANTYRAPAAHAYRAPAANTYRASAANAYHAPDTARAARPTPSRAAPERPDHPAAPNRR